MTTDPALDLAIAVTTAALRSDVDDASLDYDLTDLVVTAYEQAPDDLERLHLLDMTVQYQARVTRGLLHTLADALTEAGHPCTAEQIWQRTAPRLQAIASVR